MRVSELSTLKWADIYDDCISINKSAKHNRLKNKFSVGKTKTKNLGSILLMSKSHDY